MRVWSAGWLLVGLAVLGLGCGKPKGTATPSSDAGAVDAGGVDAGPPDAGAPDAGAADAGAPDAGPVDAGPLDGGPTDAGAVDAGAVDAGDIDAGPEDAGASDAGAVDAGALDAGPADAGAVDAGAFDAGSIDAGSIDAGSIDAGNIDAGNIDAGSIDAGPVDAGAVDAGPVDAGTLGVAVLLNTPAASACESTIQVTVGGNDIVSYRASLDSAPLGAETPIATPITADNLQPGPHQLSVIGKASDGTWQANATTYAWTVQEGGWFSFHIDDAQAATNGTALLALLQSYIPSTDRLSPVRGGDDSLIFYVKLVSGSLDATKLRIRMKASGRTDHVVLGNYVTPDSTWRRVRIPFTDFTHIEAARIANGIDYFGIVVDPGAGAGTLGIDEAKLGGGHDELLWMGDALPLSDDAGAYTTDNAAVIGFDGVQPTGGYACGTIQQDRKCEPSDATLTGDYDAERALLDSPSLPVGHPRLFGDDATWQAELDTWDNLPCMAGKSSWGRLPSMRDSWDHYSYGALRCSGASQTVIDSQRDAQFYLGGTGSWDRDRALRVMHLIRRLRACNASGRGNCWYSSADTDRLVQAFVNYELARFPNEDWYRTSPDFFDLGAVDPFRFWSLFLDVMWNEPYLTTAMRQPVVDELGRRIDIFLDGYRIEHWSQFIGNNWTPVLALAAGYWAITFYYEDPRARDVLAKVLDLLWLHRPFYLDDGSYMEGASTYVGTSFGNMAELNRLLRLGFHATLRSPNWPKVGAAWSWILENHATDGRGVDFGDSWADKGIGSFHPLLMLLYKELDGEAAPLSETFGPGGLDPCVVRRFGMNIYYDNGIQDLWDVEPALARDLVTIADQCTLNTSAGSAPTVFPLGGIATLHERVPGASVLATLDPTRDLFLQGDETFVATSAVPNDFPHREIDFGAVIWSVFGSRLLWDLGYGQIQDNNDRYATEEWTASGNNITHLDNVPSGTNTLVVEDAILPNSTQYPGHTINDDFTQISGAHGTVQDITVSGLTALKLDGSVVYGSTGSGTANDSGWLSYFYRYVVSLHDGTAATPGTDPLADGDPWNDGHMLLIDAFGVRPDRTSAQVSEYFFTKWDTTATCTTEIHDVVPSLLSPSTMELVPRCHMMNDIHPDQPEARGRIVGATLQGGAEFSLDAPFSFTNRRGLTERRQRFRYRPAGKQDGDVRAFLLYAGRQNATPPAMSVTNVACGTGAVCFDVTINGQTKRVRLEDQSGRYELISIQ